MIDPDMLEHSDRDDAVILPRFLAIVPQMKPDPIGQARCRGAARRHLVLLG